MSDLGASVTSLFQILTLTNTQRADRGSMRASESEVLARRSTSENETFYNVCCVVLKAYLARETP